MFLPLKSPLNSFIFAGKTLRAAKSPSEGGQKLDSLMNLHPEVLVTREPNSCPKIKAFVARSRRENYVFRDLPLVDQGRSQLGTRVRE